MLAGLSVALISSDMKHRNHRLNRLSRNSDQQRILRNIMGKLIDTETNTIYSIDGQKQQGMSSNSGAALTDMGSISSTKLLEDLACLEACYRCVEDYPMTNVNFLPIKQNKYYLFSISSARKKQPIIVDQCAIVLTAVLAYQSTR
jgi:hypothetical protein